MAITKVTFNTTASVETQQQELYDFLTNYGSKYFDSIEKTTINELVTIECKINIGDNYSALRFQYVNGYWRCGYVSDIHETTWNNTCDYKFKFGIATSKGIAIQYNDSIYNFAIVVISKTYEGNTFVYLPVSVGSYKTPKWVDMVTGAYGGFSQFGAGSYLYYFTGETASTSLVPLITQNTFTYSPYVYQVCYTPQDGVIKKMKLQNTNFYTNGSVALMD